MHIVIFSVIAIYTLGYILLSIPNIQDKVRHIGIKELSALLDTDITIDRIQISPFNKLELFGAYIPDLNGDTLLYANKISAGISLSDLLVDRELVFTNIQLFGLDARITKETPSSETNLQFIIDAFKSDKNTPKKKINFKKGRQLYFHIELRSCNHHVTELDWYDYSNHVVEMVIPENQSLIDL